MSKDGTPVIFHDFHIESREKIRQYPEPIGKSRNGNYIYAIKQLSVDDFKKHGLSTEYHTENVTFEELLTNLPISQ